ncbi:MAG: hypothetical protein AB8B56_12620 [Crocinitomicaceae bacterium]
MSEFTTKVPKPQASVSKSDSHEERQNSQVFIQSQTTESSLLQSSGFIQPRVSPRELPKKDVQTKANDEEVEATVGDETQITEKNAQSKEDGNDPPKDSQDTAVISTSREPRPSIKYHTPLTPKEKELYNWKQVLAQFKALESHSGISDYYMQRWARKQLSLGWSLGDPIPSLNEFRVHYGDPYVYQVTKEKVPTLYVYWYGGNRSEVRDELKNNRNYNGFWIYIDSITGHRSELQQRDSFTKYYTTHPISSSDVQLVFKFLEIRGQKFPGDSTLVTKESGTFRKAVERAQTLIYGSSVKNFGLLTPTTKNAIAAELNKEQVEKEQEFLSMDAEKKFIDAGNITALAKDPPKKNDKIGEWEGGGVNLRSKPFTPDDPKIKGNAIFESEISKSIIAHLPFGTRMTVLKETSVGSDGKDPGWYSVMTETGEKGYVAKHLVETRLPSPDVRYHLIKQDETLLQIARRYYSPTSEDKVGIVESSGEFRNYVLELARFNEEWRGDEAGAVFKAGIDSNDPKAWKETIVKSGLRMWIPSAADMYYRIHDRPEGQKFDNTNWAEDGGQWIIDNSPVTVLINSYLDWWTTIPQDVREKNVQKYYEQQLSLYEKMQTDWSWLDSYILPLMPFVPGAGAMVGVSFIYDLYVSFNIGYFDFLSKSDPKLLVMSTERTLRNLTQLEHYKGLLFGFFEGVYDWGKDLVDTFVMVGDAISTMADILTDPETYEKIANFAGDALEYVIANKDEIQKSLQDLSFMDVMIGAISGMRTTLKAKGKEMGSGAAQTLVQFAGGSPYEQGFSFGKIIGYIVPEVILAVFSSGIWVAVKGALKGVQIISKIIKPLLNGLKVGLSMLKSAARAAGDLVKFIKIFINGVLSKAKKGASKFWEKMQELFEGFHKFLKGKYDDVAKTKKAGTPDVDDYADTNKSRLRDEVKKDLDGGDKYNERLEDAIKAFAIIEMNDALDPSPPAIDVVYFLNATINLPRNDKFASRRISGDLYEISFNPRKKYTQGGNFDSSTPINEDLAEFKNVRNQRIESVESEEMKNVVRQLYKDKGDNAAGNIVGDGSAMDALRNEIKTGLPTNGIWHDMKLKEMRNSLEKLLKNERIVKVDSVSKRKLKKSEWYNLILSHNDRSVAQNLLNEINDVLNQIPASGLKK